MCHTWRHPTKKEEEFPPSLLHKLPPLSFCNITGGEPFLRDDIDEIVHVLKKKARRLVISTNGYFVEKIIDVGKRHKKVGIRISVEGLSQKNKALRGAEDGFDRALRTLLSLKRMGHKDIGFGITVCDENAEDLLPLFELACSLRFEFATACVHNSFYFHKYDNRIKNKEYVIGQFKELVRRLLSAHRVKDWYRAYFNWGLINYIEGRRRLLPCEAGTENFFLDPFAEVLPCNGMEENVWFLSMGNLKEKSFEEIWYGEQAERVREKVKNCPKNCWMIGTAAPVMKKYILEPTLWILWHKFLRKPL
jgi:radical SAM protein with 4Fe4S-binding SPASM domain